ncbi:MAG: hypothetical protein N3D73_00675 [Candidatus Diapherotrites archaeon]|nr:hypothetical protein [Candidatus Diapherotrites archaeon]
MVISLFSFCLFRLVENNYLSYEEARIINLLVENKGISRTELQRIFCLDEEYLKEIIKNLECKKLICCYANKYFCNKEDFILKIFEEEFFAQKELLNCKE